MVQCLSALFKELTSHPLAPCIPQGRILPQVFLDFPLLGFIVSIPGRVQYVSAIFPTGNLVVTHESQEAEVATSDHPAQVCYLGACD